VKINFLFPPLKKKIEEGLGKMDEVGEKD